MKNFHHLNISSTKIWFKQSFLFSIPSLQHLLFNFLIWAPGINLISLHRFKSIFTTFCKMIIKRVEAIVCGNKLSFILNFFVFEGFLFVRYEICVVSSNVYCSWDHIVTHNRYEIYYFIFCTKLDNLKSRNKYIFTIITSW